MQKTENSEVLKIRTIMNKVLRLNMRNQEKVFSTCELGELKDFTTKKARHDAPEKNDK